MESTESLTLILAHLKPHLTEHMKLNRKDYSTERALTTLVGKRRALLNYLKERDIERYRSIVKEQGLRKKFFTCCNEQNSGPIPLYWRRPGFFMQLSL